MAFNSNLDMVYPQIPAEETGDQETVADHILLAASSVTSQHDVTPSSMAAFNVVGPGREAMQQVDVGQFSAVSVHDHTSDSVAIHQERGGPSSIPRSGSWAWRSVLAGAESLKLGACFIVRSGTLFVRDNQPWLPHKVGFRPQFKPDAQVPISLKISDLWMEGSKQWNEPMLRSLFIEEDVNHIIQLKVPLDGADELRWVLENSGNFSVSSVLFARNKIRYSEAEAHLWQKLWSAAVHYRLKVTYWRWVRGVIPTRVRIQSFSNIEDVRCPLCQLEAETELHIMARCEVSRLLWFRVLGIHIRNIDIPNPLSFLESILQINDALIPPQAPQEFTDKVTAGAAMIIRRVWEARNDLVFQGKQLNMEAVAVHVENDLLMELGRMHGPTATPVPRSIQRWSPPPMECLKMNVDAAWKNGTSAIVVLARDEIAQVEGFWFDKGTHASPEEAEASAILKACQVAADLRFSKIIIESDCKVVVDAILGFSVCPWKLLGFVEDIQYFLHASTVLSVVWISRTANSAAHAGAKWVFDVIGSGSGSIREVPPSVEEACDNDLQFAYE